MHCICEFDIAGVPQVQIHSRNYSSVYGEQITLQCSVKSDPPHSNVYWQYSKNGTNPWHLNNKATGTQGMSIQNPSLTIVSTNFAHAGFYTCYASNEIGFGKSEDTILKVTGGKYDWGMPLISFFAYFLAHHKNLRQNCFVKKNRKINHNEYDLKFVPAIVMKWKSAIHSMFIMWVNLWHVHHTKFSNTTVSIRTSVTHLVLRCHMQC